MLQLNYKEYDMRSNDLSLIVMENCKEFGLKVDDHLKKIRKTEKSFILPIDAIRFSDGDRVLNSKVCLTKRIIWKI